MRWFLTLSKLLAFFLLFVFALQNTQVVQLTLFSIWHWQAPLALVLFSFFVLGVALGILALLPRLWHWRRTSRKWQAQAEQPVPPSATEPALVPPAARTDIQEGNPHGV